MLAPNPNFSPPSLFKRVLDALRPPAPRPFVEMGVSGTAVYGGYVVVRERSPEWVGAQRYMSIADMAVNASIVAAGVHYFTNLIAHPRWTVEPADKSGPAQEAADLVDSVLQDLNQPWSRVVRRASMFRFYGFGVQEWTAKARLDGRIGLSGIEPRPQHSIERWAVDDGGAVQGCFQMAPITNEELGIPRKKMLYLVDDALTDSPEGLGIFRHLAEPWGRLKQYLMLEARAFERDLRGTPVGRAPYSLLNQAVKDGTLTQEQASAALEALEKFVKQQVKQSDTAIMLDSVPYYSQAADGAKVGGNPQWAVELLQGGAAGMAEVAASITRTQTEMARLLTCEHLMMGESSGNRALGEDKSRNLYLVSNSVLGDIVAGVNQDIVPHICDLNGIPENLRPKCSAEDVAFKSADIVAGTLAKMAQAGATLAPDDPVIADVRSLMGVSAPAPVSPELLGISPPGSDEPDPEPEPDDGVEEEDAEPGSEEGGSGVEKANPNHDERGRFAEGAGGGGADALNPATAPAAEDGYSEAVVYHGTGQKLDLKSADQPLYLADNHADARGFSEGAHLGGSGDDPRVYGIRFRPGETTDIQGKIDAAVGRGDDVDEVVEAEIVRAKSGGKVRYLTFDHPSTSGGDDFKAVVSLYPKKDLIFDSMRLSGRAQSILLTPGGQARRLKKLVKAVRTLYVKRRLLNGGAVREWVRSQGLQSALPAGEMHVTVAFSRDPVDWSALDARKDAIVVHDGVRSVHQFPPRNTPNGALVLRFEAPELQRRWQELKDAGARWDFPEYLPHITLTYAVADASGMQLEPFRGPLIFGPEEWDEVNENWAGEIAEEPLAKDAAA